jgi:REP element-mobilizing transposase RayT
MNNQLSFIHYLSKAHVENELNPSLRSGNLKSNHVTSDEAVRIKNKSAINPNIALGKFRLIHGGEVNLGKRKTQRPVVPRKWMHLTLKSSLAKGRYSFLNIKHRAKIQSLINSEARRNFITLAEGVNMGNHFHLKIKCQNRKTFQKFLRTITGKIARLVTGAKKGQPFGKKFWDKLAFTRVLTTSYEVWQLKAYFVANRTERTQGYQARQEYLEQFYSRLKDREIKI